MNKYDDYKVCVGNIIQEFTKLNINVKETDLSMYIWTQLSIIKANELNYKLDTGYYINSIPCEKLQVA